MVLPHGDVAPGTGYMFNQDQGIDQNDTKSREDEDAKAFKKRRKAFTQSNPNGNLYNTENDKPVEMENYMEPGKNRREVDLQRLQHAEVGKDVFYSKGEGTVVDRRGMYVTIFNKDGKHHDVVHVGETYLPGDQISMKNMNVYWDDLSYKSRAELLENLNIPLSKYENRMWTHIPKDIQTVIKEGSQNLFFEHARGGFAGREQGMSRPDEGRSMYEMNQPKHVNQPYKDGQAKGFRKSDVEHGMYGGISTDQDPLDATEDYEDDRPGFDKKPLTGVEDKEDKPKTGFSGGHRERTDPSEPRANIEYNAKAEQNLAGITGEPTDKEGEETRKAQQDMTAITGKPNKEEGVKDPEAEAREKAITESTRWGPRYHISKEVFEKTKVR